MFKICSILVVLAIAGAAAQEGAGGEQNAAPEPYSYGYETDTHSAAEQKQPDGTVTGYYTISGDDGRQRRVEYVADASGFRAKVMTNEVGTKSANSADVEVLAQPPNPEQLVVYQQSPQWQQQQQQRQVVQVQRQETLAQPAPVTTSTSTQQRVVSQQFLQQQPQYATGYNQLVTSQYGYPGQYVYGGAYGQRNYAYGASNAYGAGSPAYATGYTTTTNTNYPGGYYSYNNHLPSQYYKSVETSSGGVSAPQQAVGAVRYVTTTTTTNNAAGQQSPASGASYLSFGRSGYQTNQAAPVQTASYRQTSSSSSNQARGSSNYIVL